VEGWVRNRSAQRLSTPEWQVMAIFCAGPCSGSNPTTDSVRVDLSALGAAAEAERLRAEQEEAERLAREAQQRAEEERERQEEEERLRLEEQRAIEEAERLEKERQRAAEEKARLEREEKARLEREEKARREEAERQAREEQERKEVAAFCQQHGFADISAPRRNGCTAWSAATTYPLHLAVELADAHIVGLLLKQGANTEQKNSTGKTAAQVAQKKDKNGSHREVKRLLTGTAAPQAAGA